MNKKKKITLPRVHVFFPSKTSDKNYNNNNSNDNNDDDGRLNINDLCI